MENQLENPGSGKRIEKSFSWARNLFSPKINKLFERYAKGDPNVELVSMNDGKTVEIGPNDKEKIIFTYALSGCFGTLVFTQHEDGRRSAALTHYAPTQIPNNMTKLRELLSKGTAMKEAKIKQAVIVMETGKWVKDAETQRYKLEPEPENEKAVRNIIIAIKAELGENIEVKSEPYNMSLSEGEKNVGIMVATIPPKGKGDAGFKTWFSAGKLG